jgi:hypothetical protein
MQEKHVLPTGVDARENLSSSAKRFMLSLTEESGTRQASRQIVTVCRCLQSQFTVDSASSWVMRSGTAKCLLQRSAPFEHIWRGVTAGAYSRYLDGLRVERPHDRTGVDQLALPRLPRDCWVETLTEFP